jgi:hypothetical protein
MSQHVTPGFSPPNPIIVFVFLTLFCFRTSYAGHVNRNEFSTKRVSSSPKIDGKLDEDIWNKSIDPTQFTQFKPNNGKKSDFLTAVELVYDDNALYLSATLYDPEPSEIRKEFGKRDDFDRNTDWFGILVDPYNSGQNAFSFFVSAAGVQGDYFIIGDDWDENWDAVWESAIAYDNNGWTVEMKIPYYALRFPASSQQNWGINFYRQVTRNQEESYWNPVDNAIRGTVNQSGVLRGLEDIKPPVRLSLLPYATTIYTNDGVNGKEKFSFTGGMDLKYGINESYTLDMALIPDFSQVQSDNVVLNLSAYEVQYSENRQFFTEGTELFDKGNLVYSRRIGSTFGEIDYDDETEEVTSSPTAAPLINATKISGRNGKGWGLGFLNAVTNKTHASIRNIETGETRDEQIDPLTNFNVLVVDKLLKNNSNVNLINTNVTRLDNGNDANVTGASVSLLDSTNTYRFSAFGAVSNIYNAEDAGVSSELEDGYKYSVGLSKVSGSFQYGVSRSVESKDYNPNDFGFNRAANSISHSMSLMYRIFKPTGVFNYYRANVSGSYSQLFRPRAFTSTDVYASTYAQFKNFWAVGMSSSLRPVNSYDYFEPREEGYYLVQPGSYSVNSWMESDARKPVALYINQNSWRRPDWEQAYNSLGASIRYRVNNKLSIDFRVSRETSEDSKGYVTKLYDEGEALQEIVFGERDVLTTNNVLGSKYTFNNKMGLTLRVRHYWSNVKYNGFYDLQSDGQLAQSDYEGLDESGQKQHDTNFNALNVDFVYFYQIAPGSFLNVVWKDSISSSDNNADINFAENFDKTLSLPQINSLSVRLTYFIDYNSARKYLFGGNSI